jgi:hypothetical protein
MQIDFKKYKLDIFIIIAFAVLSLIYCFPQLEGKKLMQSDNIHWQGMAREGMAYHDSTGKDVLWSNSMFGGMPTYTHYVASTNTNYPYYVQVVLQLIGKPAYFFFIAMLCFFLLLRVLGINKWLAGVGAIAYAFSSYNAIIIAVGHDTKMMTLAFLPAAFAGLYLIFRQRLWTGAALLAVTLALIFTSNHFQVIYYSILMFACFGIYMLYEAIKQNKIKEFLVASLVAIGAAGIGILPTIQGVMITSEYAKETMRGGASELAGHDTKTNGGLDKEYAFRWSNGIGETFCLMIPYLYGGASGESADKAPKTLEAIGGNAEELPLYWGPQPGVSGPVYFGAIICFLFVLGMMVIRSPQKWWILAACIIGIVLSWGKNFEGVNFWLFDHLPMLNKFRTVSMALVIPQFLFPLLGIWAVQEVIDQKNNPGKIWKDVQIAAAITAGICLLVGVGSSMFFNFTGGEDAQMQPEMLKLLKEDRASLAVTSGFKSAVFILLAAGLLWAFIKDKIKMPVLVAGLGLLIAIDLIPVAHDYLKEKNYVDASDYEANFLPRSVDTQILQDRDPYYRVLDLSKNTYNDASQAYFHKCIGGYHPAKMERYQDLINEQMSRGFNAQVLNMLNTKYIIVGGQKSAPHVLPNPAACGNAWFVDEVKWAKDANEEMSSLNAANIGDTTPVADAFEPKKTAVIRATFKNDMGAGAFGKDSAAYVKLAKYGLDDITFTSGNSKDGLAVFSDIYYAKGWKAFVDGKETPIMKANYVLRAIKIPAGNHSIEFHFHPDTFYNGQKIALLGSILVILLCLGALYHATKKDKGVAPSV